MFLTFSFVAVFIIVLLLRRVLLFFISLKVIGSVIRNIGTRSEISVLIIPVAICLFKKALVSIWSIAVAFVLVILVGLLIRGSRLF